MRLSVLLSYLSMYLSFYLSICLIEWAVAQVPPTPFYVGFGSGCAAAISLKLFKVIKTCHVAVSKPNRKSLQGL